MSELGEKPESFYAYDDVETMLAEDIDTLVGYLSDKFDDSSDLIDEQLELKYPHILINNEIKMHLLCGDDVSLERRNIALSAFHFAYKCTEALHTREPEYDDRKFRDGCTNSEECFEKIANETNAYLSLRPHVNELIRKFEDVIDPSGDDIYFAQMVTAMHFMYFDAGEQQRAVNLRFKEAKARLDATDVVPWDS